MASEIIPIEVRLLMNKYSRDMRQATKDASGLDAALASLQRQTKKTGLALDKIGGKIAIDLDTSALSRAESMARGFPDIDVNLDIDEEKIQSELNSLKPPDLKVNVTANEEQAQTELNTLKAPSLKVDVSANEEDVQTDLNSLTTPNLKVDVKADISNAVKQLEDLKKLAKIDLAITVGGGIFGAAQNVDNLPIIGGVNDLQMALNLLQAETGKVIPDAEKLINDVFNAGNWGATRDEVAGVIGELSKFDDLSGDLGGNAVTAFQVMQVTGADLETTIDSLRALTANGLVPDVKTAGDLIVTTFQRGGDVAGDATDTIREYSSQFAQAGIDGATALDLIIQGLQLGTRDSDKLADSFKELGIRLTTATSDMSGVEFDALQAAGLFDEAQAYAAGELSGTQFAEAAVQAAKDGLATDQNLFDIFGTPLEDFGLELFKQLDFAAAGESIIPENAAADAATLLNDNLGSALQNFGRVLESEVISKLELGGVKIADILQGATDKLYELSSLIASGVGLPDALEIALEAPGLSETIKSLESNLGNFIVELLGAFASILEFLNQGEAAKGVRAEQGRLAAQQLAFDIQVDPTNLTNVQDAFERASARGVTAAAQSQAASDAVAEMIERGEVDAAQNLINTLNDQPPVQAKVLFDRKSIIGDIATEIALPLTVDPDASQEELQKATEEAIAKFQTENPDLIAYGGQQFAFTPNLQVDTETAQANLDNAISTLETQFNDAIAAHDFDLAAALAEQLGGGEYVGVVNDAAAAYEDQTLAAIDAAVAVDNYVEAVRLANEAGLTEEAEHWQPYIDDPNLMADNLKKVEDGYKATKEQTDAAIAGLQKLGEATNSPLITGFAQKLAEQQSELDFVNEAAQNAATKGLPELQGSIDQNVISMDAFTLAQAAAFEGLLSNLDISKVAWVDYQDFLESLVLPQPLSDGSGAAPPMKPFASGGVTSPGLSLVGEQGRELISSDTALAVLNNQSTSALIQGVQMALSGMGGGNVVNHNTVNLIFNQNTAAAGATSSDRIANQARGMFAK